LWVQSIQGELGEGRRAYFLKLLQKTERIWVSVATLLRVPEPVSMAYAMAVLVVAS
jgi:hypothetical protein